MHKSSLCRHMKQKHVDRIGKENKTGRIKSSENKPNKCEVCGKLFKFRTHLLNHKNTHSKPFKCGLCSENFAQKVSSYSMKEHIPKRNRFNVPNVTRSSVPNVILRLTSAYTLERPKDTNAGTPLAPGNFLTHLKEKIMRPPTQGTNLTCALIVEKLTGGMPI